MFFLDFFEEDNVNKNEYMYKLAVIAMKSFIKIFILFDFSLTK